MNDEPVEFFAISEAAKIKLRESDLVFAESVLCNHTGKFIVNSSHSVCYFAGYNGVRLSDPLFIFPPAVLRDSHPEDEQYLEQLKNLPPPISCLELRKVHIYIVATFCNQIYF